MPLMVQPLFQPDPVAKRDLKPGTLYAVSGEGGWIYYGQITAEKMMGFFRYRSQEIGQAELIVGYPIMALIGIWLVTIGWALRGGFWQKLGRFALNPDLQNARPWVQWPVGTDGVTVWLAGKAAYDTVVHDPAIQDYEVAAAWGAISDVPDRLAADFGVEPAAWHVGGPVWRQRRVKEEMAKRFKDNAAHTLPPGYVSTRLN